MNWFQSLLSGTEMSLRHKSDVAQKRDDLLGTV